MNEELSGEQVQAILDAIDEAIAKGPWEESNFLRLFGKSLREIRNKLAEEQSRGSLESTTTTIAKQAYNDLIRSHQRLVYIALYSSEGNNLSSWERIIANISRQVLSRPVYADEQDVIYLLKSKENQMNEAYVAIYVNKEDVLSLPADKVAVDKFGKALITLKDRTLSLDNISFFFHNQHRYKYVKGHLIKTND